LKENDIPQAAGTVAPDNAAVPRLGLRMGGIKGVEAAANRFGQGMLSFQEDGDPISALSHLPDDAPDGDDLIEIFLVEEHFIFIGEADQVGGADGDGGCGSLEQCLVWDIIKISIQEQTQYKEQGQTIFYA